MSAARYLNAVVEHGHSFRVITEEYSRDAVKDLLVSHALEAITLAPAGVLEASVLLTIVRAAFSRSLGVRESQDEHKLLQKCEELARDRDSVVLFVAANRVFEDSRLMSVLRSLEPRTPFYDSGYGSSGDPHVQLPGASERELLRDARRELLRQVLSFTSEELASGGGSISDNPSQYALDLRSRGKVFGVRFGRTWHYPRFQFDAQRRAVPEMKAVLDALSPDPQGWDRLQWFVTPHEKLNGQRPLGVWATDRQKVIDAAQSEQWHGRRD